MQTYNVTINRTQEHIPSRSNSGRNFVDYDKAFSYLSTLCNEFADVDQPQYQGHGKPYFIDARDYIIKLEVVKE